MATNGKSNYDLCSKLVTVFPLKHVDKYVRASARVRVRVHVCWCLCDRFFYKPSGEYRGKGMRLGRPPPTKPAVSFIYIGPLC